MNYSFSTASLMVLVLIAAVVFGVVRSASDGWPDLVFTVVLGFMAVAVLGALAGRGRKRAFLAGTAAGGWGYLALSLGIGLDSPEASPLPSLPTTSALRVIHGAIYSEALLNKQAIEYEYCTCSRCEATYRARHWARFARFGHSIFGLLIGLPMGAIASRSGRPSERNVP